MGDYVKLEVLKYILAKEKCYSEKGFELDIFYLCMQTVWYWLVGIIKSYKKFKDGVN